MIGQTNKQQKLWIFHEHIVAFVLACFFVAGVVGVFLYRDTLFADITASVWSNNAAKLPLVYSVAEGALHITSTRTFEKATSMTFFIVFDPSSVLLQLEDAKSPYEFTFAPSMETMMQVTVLAKWNIPANTTLFTLPLDGSVDNITISNAGVLRDNWKFEPIAIQKK